MFKTNRHLLVASTVGMVSIACLMLLYRQLTLSSLVTHETRSNIALTQVFSNSLWQQYRHLLQYDGSDGVPEANIGRLGDDVRHLMRGSNVVKVKIYDLHGLTLYSSDPSQIGEDKSANQGYLSARDGSPASNITYRDKFDAFEGQLSSRNVVSSYIPIWSPLTHRPEAVFEVYSDVTDLIRQVKRIQWYIVVGVLSSVAIIYVLLLSSARRVDRVEEQRREDALQNEQKIYYQARHDPLTELPNRVSFLERLAGAINRASRQKRMLGVMFLDVDGFKLVNDSFGHVAGDELLRLTASRLRRCMRESDTLFRMGSDEFTVLLEGLDYPEGAMSLARRILEAMKEPFLIHDHSFVSTISIGITVYPKDDVEPAKLIKNADAAMCLAKDEGRSQFRFYTPELNAHALERLALESGLQQALPNGEFSLHYQPRLASDAATVVGFEALLRWRREDGEMVPPERFIPVLEQTGLITEVGQWVLREACLQCKRWASAGHAPVRVSVNVSPRQFRGKYFVDSVREVLEQTGLDPHYLELELTESALLDDPTDAIAVMKALKALGVILSMDDFGTGYSSFSYLKQLPVDYLKIDRSFVQELDCSSKDVAIVGAIAGVAHSLGIGLVAEGVEKTSQVDRLLSEGCSELQGFLYSKPLPPEIAQKWLRPAPSTAVAG